MAVKKNTGGVDKPQVIKKKSNGNNSPMLGMNAYDLEPGDNAKYLRNSMHLMNLPEIDLHDVEQVANRLNEYFEFMAASDMKPTVSGMALALNGMSRQNLWAITHDAPTGGCGYMTALPKEVADVLKKAYRIMEVLWEDYVQNGKINPVMGIFLGKNNFGYKDKTEYVVTPNVQQDNDYDADAIRERYLIDSNDSDPDTEND